MIPISNIETNEISGVKENTFEYFHEKAHIDFNKSNLGMNINYLAQMSEYYTIICLTLSFFVNFFKWFSLVGVLIMLSCFTFEEVYCDIKAKENLGTTKRNI